MGAGIWAVVAAALEVWAKVGAALEVWTRGGGGCWEGLGNVFAGMCSGGGGDGVWLTVCEGLPAAC